MSSKRALLALFWVLFASPTAALWSSDPAVNLVVGNGAGEQVLPKVAPTPDGGAWIGWFDGGAGYDVRVQKLDAAGNGLLPHNGVLVANRSFSSVQDWGLDIDSSGNALLAFRDDRFGGEQITAAKVTPAGTLAWGVNGVQLTATSDFVASPKIAGTSDGGAVVTWTQNASTKLQKLDGAGAPQWVTDVTLTPGAGSYSASDLHDAGTDVILAFVHQTGSFGSPRHLLAQKFDATGALLWGAGHVAVFDGGSLQFGNFPYFVPDGLGGAGFSWYDASTTALQCYAQRILPDGTEAFPHNGTAVSTNAVRVRVSPSAAFDAATGMTYVFWEEQNSSQSQSGLYGQKVDATGARKWGTEGVAVVPVGASQILLVRTLTGGSGAFAFWSGVPSFNQDRLYGVRLDASGVVDVPIFDVASTPSGKSRLSVGKSPTGVAILAWSDQRTDGGDIYAQNVNADGSLGAGTSDAPSTAPGPGLALGAPRPNPSAGTVALDFRAPARGAVTLLIRDVAGRLVRRIDLGSAERGTATWDGRDDDGERVAGGVYFAELRWGDLARGTRITLLR